MKKKSKKRSKSRRTALKTGIVLLTVLTVWGFAGEWFVHHPRPWIESKPKILSAPLLLFGNPLADLTDALDLTGYDTVCEYDTEAPEGEVVFAGAPQRVAAPAPADIRVLRHDEFLIGWSDSLRHPVWCAYHVVKDARHENAKRPGFTKDRDVPLAPSPNDYTKSGYDRGHMVPNYAIVTRYGESEQKRTFQMSNVAPQSAALNRGAWRDIEHRIADLWTARYGEIWVVVGCCSATVASGETVSGTNIDVPEEYYQVIIAQEGMEVRALAMVFPQNIPWRAWPARYIVTIEELEQKTGLNFNPELPEFAAKQLEADRPSRLWPIRPLDIFRQILIHYK